MKYNKGKRWTDEEEEKVLKLLKNNKSMEECSDIIGRSEFAIKIRIEEIIYKKITYKNKTIDELEYLTKHIDSKVTIENIIKKYENKYKNKKNIPMQLDVKKSFENDILIRLENIELNQKKIINEILIEKNNEINIFKKEIEELKEIKNKNEKKIKELIQLN
jgi:hypothetical protein